MYMYTSSNFVFVFSIPPPLFGFEFDPANSGGVELARKCQPAHPGSVYRSSIPWCTYMNTCMYIYIYVYMYTSPFFIIYYLYLYIFSNYVSSFLLSPTFVWFSNSTRQIREALSWHASAGLRILGLSDGLPFLGVYI